MTSVCVQDPNPPALAAVLDLTADATGIEGRKVGDKGEQDDDDDDNVEWAGEDDVLE